MQPGRNDLCHCGSGKKFKKCCGSGAVARPAQAAYPATSQAAGAAAGGRSQIRDPGLDANDPANLLRAGRWADASVALEKRLRSTPEDSSLWQNLAYARSQLGQTQGAVQAMQRATELAPAQAGLWANYAAALFEHEDYAAAAEASRRALALAPDAVGAWMNLGNACFKLGQASEAVQSFRRVLAAHPRSPEALNALGLALLAAHQPHEAQELFEQLVAVQPQSAAAHLHHGHVLKRVGLLDQAATAYQNALRLRPDDAEARYQWGEVALLQGQMAQAEALVRQALRTRPDQTAWWQTWCHAAGACRFDSWHPELAEMVQQALLHPAVDAAVLEPAASSLLLTHPALQAWAEAGTEAHFLAVAELPLLRFLLQSALVTDLRLEDLLTRMRLYLLAGVVDGDHLDPAHDLLAALALQCYLGDYAWPCDASELAQHGVLLELMGTPFERNWDAVAVLALYQPLVPSWCQEVDPVTVPGWLQPVWQQQWLEPQAERIERAQLVRITPVADEVSQYVRQQYEENPYPRWTSVGYVAPQSLIELLASLFPRQPRSRMPHVERPRVLIAGCGTGRQVVGELKRLPDAEMLALDLSLTSLAYARRRVGEMQRAGELDGVRIDFAQADITQLDRLPGLFDVIESVGVLHHLQDPMAGWQRLLEFLAPGGVMKIGLYARAARWFVREARQAYPRPALVTQDALRVLRSELIHREEPWAVRLHESPDFYSLSGLRDLLWHAQEQDFELADVAAMLEHLGLMLLGFEHADPHVAAVYRERFPDDPTQTDWSNWQRLETELPDLFRGMMQFWVMRQPG